MFNVLLENLEPLEMIDFLVGLVESGVSTKTIIQASG